MRVPRKPRPKAMSGPSSPRVKGDLNHARLSKPAHYPSGPVADEPADAPVQRTRRGALRPERSDQGRQHRAAGAAQSLADHVDLALDRVKGLGPKQRLALHNEMLRMLRDIEVIRLVAHSARGPWSEAADSGGRWLAAALGSQLAVRRGANGSSLFLVLHA